MNTAQHLWSFLSGKKTYLIALAGTIYAWGITHSLWQNDPLVDTLLLGGGAAALRHGWKTEAAKIVQTILESPPALPAAPSGAAIAPAAPQAATPAPIGSKTGAANPLALFVLFLSLALGCLTAVFVGCASLAPGADPFVVRIEQTESSAKPAFDFVLGTEDLNREFWQTNVPGLYTFCEWLRQPQPVTGPTAFGTNISMNLPRASAMQWNLDQVKQSYKAGRATSNDVFTVLSTLEGAVSQAATWANVITNK